jgi:hypothetical protein
MRLVRAPRVEAFLPRLRLAFVAFGLAFAGSGCSSEANFIICRMLGSFFEGFLAQFSGPFGSARRIFSLEEPSNPQELHIAKSRLVASHPFELFESFS